MTQRFTDDGNAVPVTVVEAGPCVVSQVKTEERDGYNSVQIGFGTAKKLSKAEKGHVKKLGDVKHLREFRLDEPEELERGNIIKASVFTSGDIVAVRGTSKGRGFQGVVKRHGFHGSPASHGHKDQLRMPGSIGATDAARVFKGTRMGGHMGASSVTLQNLTITEVDAEKNLLFIQGAVPGARGSLLLISGEGTMDLNAAPQKEEVVEKQDKPDEKKEKNVEKQESKEAADMKKEKGSEQK